MFHPIFRMERLHLMTQRKCHSCGKDAFAYLIEAYGSRLYFCLEHFPTHDAPRPGDEKPPQGKTAGSQS